MKRHISILLVAVGLLFASCDDLLSIINYDLDFATGELTINSNEVTDTTYSLTSDMIDPMAALEDVGIDSVGMVSTAKVKTLSIELIAPETGNFNWAKSASVHIQREGEAPELLGSIDLVPDDVTMIDILGSELDVLPYIEGGAFKLIMEATTDEQIMVDHRVKVHTTFNVSL